MYLLHLSSPFKFFSWVFSLALAWSIIAPTPSVFAQTSSCPAGNCRTTCTSGETEMTQCSSLCGTSAPRFCVTSNSTGTVNNCPAGNCRASCVTGEIEMSQCSASLCSLDPAASHFCTASSTGGTTTGGSTTSGTTCAEGFSSYAGVCFPGNTGLSEATIGDILVNFFGWLFGIFGFLALIAFLISGSQYLIASGDDDMIKTAKRNMKYSIVGVIVGLAGYVIIQAISMALSATNPFF